MTISPESNATKAARSAAFNAAKTLKDRESDAKNVMKEFHNLAKTECVQELRKALKFEEKNNKHLHRGTKLALELPGGLALTKDGFRKRGLSQGDCVNRKLERKDILAWQDITGTFRAVETKLENLRSPLTTVCAGSNIDPNCACWTGAFILCCPLASLCWACRKSDDLLTPARC